MAPGEPASGSKGGISRSVLKTRPIQPQPGKPSQPAKQDVEPEQPALDPQADTPGTWASKEKYLSEFWGLTGPCRADHPFQPQPKAFCAFLGSPQPPVEWTEFWSSRASAELKLFIRSWKYRVKVPWELRSLRFENNLDKQILQLNIERNQSRSEIYRCNAVPTILIFAKEEKARMYDKAGWQGAWRKEANMMQPTLQLPSDALSRVQPIPNTLPRRQHVYAGYGNADDRQDLITLLNGSWIKTNTSWVPYTGKSSQRRVDVYSLMLKDLNDLVHITYQIRKYPGLFGTLESLWQEESFAWEACGDVWDHTSSQLIRARCEDGMAIARYERSLQSKRLQPAPTPVSTNPQLKPNPLYFFKQGLENCTLESPAGTSQDNHQRANSSSRSSTDRRTSTKIETGASRGGELSASRHASSRSTALPSSDGQNHGMSQAISSSTISSGPTAQISSSERKNFSTGLGATRRSVVVDLTEDHPRRVVVVDLTQDHQRRVSSAQTAQDRSDLTLLQTKGPTPHVARNSTHGSGKVSDILPAGTAYSPFTASNEDAGLHLKKANNASTGKTRKSSIPAPMLSSPEQQRKQDTRDQCINNSSSLPTAADGLVMMSIDDGYEPPDVSPNIQADSNTADPSSPGRSKQAHADSSKALQKKTITSGQAGIGCSPGQSQQAEEQVKAARGVRHRPQATPRVNTSDQTAVRSKKTVSNETVVARVTVQTQVQEPAEPLQSDNPTPTIGKPAVIRPQERSKASSLRPAKPKTGPDTRIVPSNEDEFWAELYFSAGERPPPSWVETTISIDHAPRLLLLPWARRNPFLMRISKSAQWRANKQIDINGRLSWKAWRGLSKKHARIRWSEKETMKLRAVERTRSAGLRGWMNGKLCQKLIRMEVECRKGRARIMDLKTNHLVSMEQMSVDTKGFPFWIKTQ